MCEKQVVPITQANQKQTNEQSAVRILNYDSAITLESMNFHVPRPAQIELHSDNTHWLKVGQTESRVILCCATTVNCFLIAQIYS